MSDDNRFGYSKNRSASVIFEVKVLQVRILNVTTFNNILNGFCQFQYNIAGEPFAYDDIRFVVE